LGFPNWPVIYFITTAPSIAIRSQCLPIPPGVFWEEIVERSIKHSKTLTAGDPSQHPTTGSGAGKLGTEGTIEPEEVMMVKETWMQPYLAYMIKKTQLRQEG
jgi:hypothetical protein